MINHSFFNGSHRKPVMRSSKLTLLQIGAHQVDQVFGQLGGDLLFGSVGEMEPDMILEHFSHKAVDAAQSWKDRTNTDTLRSENRVIQMKKWMGFSGMAVTCAVILLFFFNSAANAQLANRGANFKDIAAPAEGESS